MEGTPLGVQWSKANDNKFVVWGSEIDVYETKPTDPGELDEEFDSCNGIVEQWWSKSVKTCRIRCIDVHPRMEQGILVAVGLNNGNIVLAPYGEAVIWSQQLETKFLESKQPRRCNAVAWNPIYTSLIVGGLDAHAGSHTILIWNIRQPQPISITQKPIVKFEHSTTHSLSWFKKSPMCFVAGINQDSLKIFDMRKSGESVSETSTNCVYGAEVSPHNNFHILSHYSSNIKIWDTRSFKNPFLTITKKSSNPFTQVLWSPTRSNLVGSIDGKHPFLKMYRIHQVGNENNQIGRNYYTQKNHKLSMDAPKGFAWHPNHVDRFIVISPTKLIDRTFGNRTPIGWSTKSRLTWSDGVENLKYLDETDGMYKDFGDIGVLTKKRAATDYGTFSELAANGEIIEDDTLRKLWRWMTLSQLSYEEGPKLSEDIKCPGIKPVLKMNSVADNEFVQSEIVDHVWTDVSSNNHSATIYRSKDRDRALKLCGWSFDEEESSDESEKNKGIFRLNNFLKSLETEGSYSRATAIAIFNLDLKQAVEILGRGTGKIEMDAVTLSFALSGFSEKNLWKETCSKVTLNDSYLNAVFSFLSTDNDNYNFILYQNEIEIEDRVAFSLIYLSDTRLTEYFVFLKCGEFPEGDLGGFFLTGGSQEGIEQLERYMEISGDVQSSTVIALNSASKERICEEPIKTWIESYRILLNSWKMWSHRSRFDMFMRKMSGTKPPSQMYLACYACGKSLVGNYLRESLGNAAWRRDHGQASQKMSAFPCPRCRRSLPRCAICLMDMELYTQVETFSNFSKSFSWCMTCKHGGHVGHLYDWFKTNSTCPVKECECECMAAEDIQ